MYTIASSLDTDTPIMLVNQQIGFDPETGQGIDGPSFERELLSLDTMGYRAIKLYINSPGGIVTDGMSICNAILRTKTPVDTYCSGICASIAASIFMAGRKRIMLDYGRLMFHNPSGGDDKKALDAMRGSIITMIASRSGMDEASVGKMLDKTTWLDAEEAKSMGLCTEIEKSNGVNKPTGSFNSFYKMAASILNSSLNIESMETNQPQGRAQSVSLIANYLGLSVDATEGSVLTEIKNRINGAILAKTKAEEELDETKKALDKMKKDLEAKKAEYEKMCKDYDDKMSALKAEKDKAEKDKKDAEDKAKTEKATALVQSYVKAGKIKNEPGVVAKWTAMAMVDEKSISEMLGDLPVNLKAQGSLNVTGSAAGTSDVVDLNSTPMSAMNLMAQVQAKMNKSKQS